MQGYWIETEYFATSLGDFTPEQYDDFEKLCQKRSEANDVAVPILVHDYTQDWEKMKFNPRREVDDFWEEARYHDFLVEDQSPGTTFVKIFPKDTIKEQPHSFDKKRILYDKIIRGRKLVYPFTEVDWNLMKELLDLAEYARGDYGEQSTQGEPPPVESATADSLPIIMAASGKGNPKSLLEVYNEQVEWANDPGEVIVKNEEPIITSENPDSPMIGVLRNSLQITTSF